MTVIASRATPAASSSASAPSSSLDVTAPLKRLTTIPTARRRSLRLALEDAVAVRHREVALGVLRAGLGGRRLPPPLLDRRLSTAPPRPRIDDGLVVARRRPRRRRRRSSVESSSAGGSSSSGVSGQRSLTPRLRRRARARSACPGGAARGRACRAWRRDSAGSRRSAAPRSAPARRPSSPKPSMPEIFFGLFVRTRIVVRPRSARICEPIPYSRWSAGKPSPRFASTVSSPCSWSS